MNDWLIFLAIKSDDKDMLSRKLFYKTFNALVNIKILIFFSNIRYLNNLHIGFLFILTIPLIWNLNIMQIFLTLFVSLEPTTKNKWCRNWIRISFNMVSENELSLIWTLPQFVVWALITMEKYIWPQQYQCHIYADDSGLSMH